MRSPIPLSDIWNALRDDLGLLRTRPMPDRSHGLMIGQRSRGRIVTDQWHIWGPASLDAFRPHIAYLADTILSWEPDLFATAPTPDDPNFRCWKMRDREGLLRIRVLEGQVGAAPPEPFHPFDLAWRLDVLASVDRRWKKAKAAV